MKINLKTGIDELIFGMTQKNVMAVYGEPDRQYKDDENNIIYLYNDKRIRVTFYEDEDMRMGYLICSHPDLELFGNRIIGRPTAEVQEEITEKGIKSWEVETFDSVDNVFNESNWLILQSEFEKIIRVEVGATINDNDEFDWKFKAR
ncbi:MULTISPECIES: hypothetical protein [unclassified Flavobacterium]|uniref:hypothetical protein n=1 Tax=unclassified Flavobacterium TaxID=196869 RepID=UPI00095DDDA5|nr:MULTISPECIES: hypothetical protein [unclassified Flavobacterium]MBN9282852.1 hypothetical protein [Flavobacterium sp.]OJV67497.1 MAG: hypothetical protein BGO42_15775 [Flavobacterium sp. 40-81]